jgi:uncharacterized membrane protein YsdA (DUF1294 family)/cold shock CspA family protein
MRYQGKIIKWYDDKGFGFIRAAVDSKDVFLHISQIHKLKKRPEINELVTYEVTKDEKGRFRAVNVAYLVAQDNSRKSDNSTSFSFIFLAFVFIFTAFVLERTLTGHLPLFYIFIFFGANLVVFLYYYQDKISAVKHSWRTPENTLHWLSLLGGWGGAYIAQKLFKHKHKKMSFMFTYKFTVIFNCLAIILYSVPQLLAALQTLLF